eukprot:3334388-Heterocapsa_arctica.AAC.1
MEEGALLTCPNCGLHDEDEYHRWYICGCHNECRLQREWIRSKAQKELNHADEVTGEIKPLRQHLWIRGLPQKIDVGSPLLVDESSTEVVRGA